MGEISARVSLHPGLAHGVIFFPWYMYAPITTPYPTSAMLAIYNAILSFTGTTSTHLMTEEDRLRYREYQQLYATSSSGDTPVSGGLLDEEDVVYHADRRRALSEQCNGRRLDSTAGALVDGRALEEDGNECDDDDGDASGYCTQYCEEWCEWSATSNRHFYWSDPTCTCSEFGCEKKSFPVDGWNTICMFGKCSRCNPCVTNKCADWCRDSAESGTHFYWASDCETKKSFSVDGWSQICNWNKCSECSECT